MGALAVVELLLEHGVGGNQRQDMSSFIGQGPPSAVNAGELAVTQGTREKQAAQARFVDVEAFPLAIDLIQAVNQIHVG